MRRINATAVAIMVVLVAFSAHAQIPQTLNYQGVLTDAGGSAVTDGDYSVEFSIYDVASGGSALWNNTKTVSVSHGIFNVILGESSPLNLDFDTQYYLGMAVEGESELTPRVTLNASAYSLNSRGVTGSSNIFPPAGKVGIGTMSPNVDAKAHIMLPSSGNFACLMIECPDNNKGYGIEFVNPDGSWLVGPNVGNCTDNNFTISGPGTGLVDFLRILPTGEMGIGLTSPVEKLDVDGGVKIGNSTGSNAGTIRWTGADFEGYDGGSWQSLTGGGGSLPSGTAGQTLRHNGSNWVANSGIYNNGTYIGIGDVTPEAKLNIGGGQWNLNATEGDFKIGDSTYRLKFGVATGGGGAGSAGIRVQGGMARLILGAGSKEVLHVDSTGTVSIGSDSYTGDLEVYRQGISDPMARIYTNTQGGLLHLKDELNNSTIRMEPDADGEGGYFSVTRGTTSYGFYVNGNDVGSNEPLVTVLGSVRSAVFRMNNSGDASVELPADAIASDEMLNETGGVSYGNANAVSLTDADYTTIASQSIATPAGGYVLVIATTQAQANHTYGTTSEADFGVSTTTTSFPTNQDVTLNWGAELPTNSTCRAPVTVHCIFEVASAGDHTFYFLGYEHSGSFTCWDTQFSVLYFPTAYGTISSMAPTGTPDDDAAPVQELTASFVENQKTESVEANNARIQRELEEMRERLEKLERMARQENQ
jgi:hypothetical protein